MRYNFHRETYFKYFVRNFCNFYKKEVLPVCYILQMRLNVNAYKSSLRLIKEIEESIQGFFSSFFLLLSLHPAT